MPRKSSTSKTLKKSPTTNLTYRCSNMSQKIAFVLVLAIIFNTFTNVFLLLTLDQRIQKIQNQNLLQEKISLAQPTTGSLTSVKKYHPPTTITKQTSIEDTLDQLQASRLDLNLNASDIENFSSLSSMANSIIHAVEIETSITNLQALKKVYDSSSKNPNLERKILRALRKLVQNINEIISNIQEVLDNCASGKTCPKVEGAVEFLTELQATLIQLRDNLIQTQKNVTATFDILEQTLEDLKNVRINLQDSLTLELQAHLNQLQTAFYDNAAYSTSDPTSLETTYGALSHAKNEWESLIEKYAKLKDLPNLIEELRPLLELFGIDVDALIEVSDPQEFIIKLQARIKDDYQEKMNAIASSLETAGQIPQLDMEDGVAWVQSFVLGLKQSIKALAGIDEPARTLQELLPDIILLDGALNVLDEIIDGFLNDGASQLDEDVARLTEDVIAHTATTTLILGFYDSMELCAKILEDPASCGETDPLCLKTFGDCLSTQFLGYSLNDITNALKTCTPTEGLQACLQEDSQACVTEIIECVTNELRR